MDREISRKEWDLLESEQGRTDVISKLRESKNQPVQVKELRSSRTKGGLLEEPFNAEAPNSINKRFRKAGLKFKLKNIDRYKKMRWEDQRLHLVHVG